MKNRKLNHQHTPARTKIESLILAGEIADRHGLELIEGLQLVGIGNDQALLSITRPGETYNALAWNDREGHHWETRTIEAETDEEPSTDYDAQDHYEMYLADEHYHA